MKPAPQGTPAPGKQGLIAGATGPTAKRQAGNPQLQQIIDGMEAKVKQAPPAIQHNYQAIVVSGMKLLYSPQTMTAAMQYIEHIKAPTEVPKYVAHGVLQMIAIISKEAKGQMRMPAAALAAVTLMAMALQTVEAKLKMTVTPDLIAQTHTAMMTGLFKLFNINRAQIQVAVDQGKAALAQKQASNPSSIPAPTIGGAPSTVPTSR